MNTNFIGYGSTDDICLPPGNKTCQDNIQLGFNYKYYNKIFTYVKICIDGNIPLNGSTFSNKISGLLSANVSTLSSGTVCYRSISDSPILSLVSQIVIQEFSTTSYFQFSAVNVVVATWNTVQLENSTASFQIVLVTDGTFSFLIYLYGSLRTTNSSYSFVNGYVPAIVYFNANTNQTSLAYVQGQSKKSFIC